MQPHLILYFLPLTLSVPIPAQVDPTLQPRMLDTRMMASYEALTPAPVPAPAPAGDPKANNASVGMGPQTGDNDGRTTDPNANANAGAGAGAPEQEGGAMGGATAASAGRAGHP